ncbi:MAG: DUF1073 domain-containing protein [candidate division Zixibacteria bacterium]|nr:DUF1073 domain-containing protein [candidate division Zixibacteria bacterium]
MWPFSKKQTETAPVEAKTKELMASDASSNWRQRVAAGMSGTNYTGDTLHQIALDFGYPDQLSFQNFWNMYRRFGIAKNVVELKVDTGWMSPPKVEGSEQFNKDLEKVIESQNLWLRTKGLDTRQRVGRYAGMFMRVRDGKKPDQPIAGKLSGTASLVQMIPLYESQLEVVSTEQDPMADDFGLPTMYQFRGAAEGNRNKDDLSSFNIHPDRIVIAAEDADNGGIYGISALEAPYNSLMDLRKIIGAGGEGFYKNASKDVVFNLKEGASAKGNEALLDKFNEQYDDFVHNRARRAMWTPGMEAKTLDSSLANPKEYLFNALYDVAAAEKTPATIIIGQQTGRLASGEDSRSFLSTVGSRQENFQTELVMNHINWMIKFGILPFSEYTVEWDDLLASSDKEKLDNAKEMSTINKEQFGAGKGTVFESEEIREAAGFETEPDDDLGEELDEEIEDEIPEED